MSELGELGNSKTHLDSSSSFKQEGACSGRTRVEKILLFLVVVFLIAVIGLVVALVIVAKDSEEKKTEVQPEVCGTADCAKAAARLLESIDFTADPCVNFYDFSCGAWRKKNVIPEDKGGQNVFGLLRDEVQVINKYLLEDVTSYPNVEAIRKVKDLYAACIDLAKIEQRNENVTYPLLEELGGWPVLGSNIGGNWNSSTFDLVILLVKLRKYNNSPLLRMYVSSDLKDTTKHILYIDQPTFGMPGRDYYLDEKLDHMREAYVNFAKSLAVLLGADANQAETDMRQVLKLETDIANITMKAEDRRDSELLYNKMTIEQVAQNFTEPSPSDPIQFRWLDYVQSVMGMDGIKIQINETEPVVIRAVPYFEKLLGVLQQYEPRDVANYLVWYIMKNRASNLPKKFTDLVTAYNEVLTGTSSDRARWRTCVSSAEGQMGFALGHMFVKETFDESAKVSALDMIQLIRDTFNEILDELDWMDENTKDLARAKSLAIKEWIGYPERVLNVDELNKMFENFTISKENYFENVLNGLKKMNIDDLSALRKPFNKSIWDSAPSTVNAFYSPTRNTIMFPAGILQPPLYSKNQPKSMNFGGMGMVIGHEITHGFDDRGRQYDKEGNLVEWWDEAIITKFKEKAQCIVDQYSGFLLKEANLTLNGINTQGENIADNGGIKQSFRAYRKWVEAQGKEEPMLPGVNFTHNQLFFINFAQIWCNNLRPETAISAIKTNVHSPGEFRVIGPLQNSPDFSTAFNCPASSYMNRPNKCYVW